MLVTYGTVEAWLGNLSSDSQVKRSYCAAWLCPEEFWANRTFVLLQQSASGESASVLPEMRRALLEDPASAYAWANLAEAERDAQQFALAKYCFERAILAGPGNPAILFRAANFAFLLGDRAAVLRYLWALLKNPDFTGYYEAAFLTYSRLGEPIDELLEKGIPAVATAAEPFLEFWMNDNQLPQAAATWQWMVKHALATDASCGSYVSFLLRNQKIDEAAEEWRRAYARKAPNYQLVNWIFNGGFEMEPTPGPFDWHIETTPEVEATRVEEASHDGQWSVRLAFKSKSEADYHGVYQEAAIKPGQWSLRGFLKLDNIASERGIAIRVYDPQQPGRLDVSTEPQSGTHEWSQAERVFEVGPLTKLVRVEIVRSKSSAVGGKVFGRAWVDSLDLSPVH